MKIHFFFNTVEVPNLYDMSILPSVGDIVNFRELFRKDFLDQFNGTPYPKIDPFNSNSEVTKRVLRRDFDGIYWEVYIRSVK